MAMRGAEAALEAVMLVERLLQRMQLVCRRRDALDGENVVTICLHRQQQAGARREPVQKNGAGAANTVLTAEMGAGEPELMAQEVGERQAHLDLLLMMLPVNGQRNFSPLTHSISFIARMQPACPGQSGTARISLRSMRATCAAVPAPS
jgi:hypothetical protein